MSDPFVAEIRILPYSFAPRDWAYCDGQLIQLGQNTALYSLIGTTYGGDGHSTFALPNLQGAVPLHRGQGPGLSDYAQGKPGGMTTVTLTEDQMPGHVHSGSQLPAVPADRVTPFANTSTPAAGTSLGTTNAVDKPQLKPYASGPADTLCYPLAAAGGDQPHNNLMPTLVMTYCIALSGVFPPRS